MRRADERRDEADSQDVSPAPSEGRVGRPAVEIARQEVGGRPLPGGRPRRRPRPAQASPTTAAARAIRPKA